MLIECLPSACKVNSLSDDKLTARMRVFMRDVKVWCFDCGTSTWHSRVRRYMRQVDGKFVPCDYPTAMTLIMLKCQICGKLSKNIRTVRWSCRNNE